MCGIIAIAARQPFPATETLTRLQRLAYRGYDSYGYAFPGTGRKDTGSIAIHETDATATGTCVIAHTRWATHGGVTIANAHPHRSGSATIVHNGIIENYEELAADATFASETDSERLAARLDLELKSHAPLDALRAALSAADGIWAVAALVDGQDGILVARQHVPLVIGRTPQGHVVASDARAIPDADLILPLGDGHLAHVTADRVQVQDVDGEEIAQAWERNLVEPDADRADGYAMEHEILETPLLLERMLKAAPEPTKSPVTFIGCGSSVNAARFALALARHPAQALLASEYDADIDPSPTVVAVSQSGETADVLDAVRKAQQRGKRIIAIVNAPHTTLTRLADTTLLLGAGEERCVAATKSFTLQAVLIARLLGVDLREQAIIGAHRAIGRRETIRSLARDLATAEHLFLVGRGPWLALAQEIALKLKEVAYQHAEAVPAFELKHGPLALITPRTPVVAFGELDDTRLRSTIHEVSARDGRVVRLLSEDRAAGAFDALIGAQLLAFEIARLRDTPIDHPRNLAKSVTVY